MVESLLSLLNGDASSRTVWTADLDYWIAGREEKRTSDPAWRTEEGFLTLCSALRVMPYYYYPKLWLARSSYDPAVKVGTSRRGNAHANRLEDAGRGDLGGTDLAADELFQGLHETCGRNGG